MNIDLNVIQDNIYIKVENITLASYAVLENAVWNISKVKIYNLNSQDFYESEKLKKSQYFQEFKKLQNELIEFWKNNKNIEKYILPNNLFIWINIEIDKEKIQDFMIKISLLNSEELVNLYNKLLSILNINNIKINIFPIYKENNIKARNFLEETYWFEKNDDDEIWLFTWIDNKDRVNIIFEWDFDNQISTSILYKNLSSEWLSIEECIDIVENMDNSDKEVLIKLTLWSRNKWDFIPNVLGHSTIMYDLIIDFSTYMELISITKWFRIFTWPTAILWYDYPSFLDKDNELKDVYDDLMTKITIFAKKVQQEDDEILFYTWAWWHLVRTTLELNPIELMKFLEFDSSKNESLKLLQQEMFFQFKKLSPILSRYIKI